MITKSTFRKLLLITLITLGSQFGWAATFYTCINTNLNVGTAPTGISYLWDLKKDGIQVAGYPSATAPSNFTSAGSYELILHAQTDATAGLCQSDPVVNTIIVLPELGINLSAPTLPAYCVNSSVASSDIIATITGFLATYNTDLTTEYSYSVVKDSDAPVDGSTLGTIDATGKYTLTTTIPGVYKITGTVKYKQIGSNTLLGSGCPISSTEQTITVTPQPTAPTIIITAAP
jgi:hypothetical protein